MEKHRLQPLTETERRSAEINHNIIYKFLHQFGFSIDDFYGIAVMGYLKGIQRYHRDAEIQGKYPLYFVCWQYIRAEISNHFRIEKARKRQTAETILSLADGLENLYWSDRTPEKKMMESEFIKELLGSLSIVQRKIICMRLDGYTNKEIYLLMEIRPATYYRELQRIKNVVERVLMQ